MLRSASRILMIVVPVFLAIGIVSANIYYSYGYTPDVFPSFDKLVIKFSEMPSPSDWFTVNYENAWSALQSIPETWANVDGFVTFWEAVGQTFFSVSAVPVGIVTVMLYPVFIVLWSIWAVITLVLPA